VPEWIDRFLDSVFPGPTRARPRLFHRRICIAGAVRAWLDHPDRTRNERLAFAEMVLRLDRNPVGDGTHPILGSDRPPGVRCVDSGVVRVVYEWNPVENRVRIAMCSRSM